MAQILGCYLTELEVDGHRLLDDMAERMRRPTQEPAQSWSPGTTFGGLGALLGNEVGTLMSVAGPEGGAVAIDGRLTAPVASAKGIAADLLELYRRNGPAFVASLRGSFALILWDAARRRVVCATDRFGTRTLYWTHMPAVCAISTELKGFLALPDLKVEPDPEAVAAYLRYGRLFGSRTIWRSTYRLPPATVLVFDAAGDSVHTSVYWRVESTVQQRHTLTPDRKEALSRAFRTAVLSGCTESGHVGLSLSGGLDSRAILAVLAGAKQPALLRTEGVAGCVDERVAARLAAATGMPWRFNGLQPTAISNYVEAMRRYVYLSEGMMVPDGYPGISALQFALEEGITVLQRGHGGEMARTGDGWPFQVRDEVVRQRNRAELLSYLEREGDRTDPHWLRLFTNNEMCQAIANPADTYAHVIDQFDSAMTPAEILNLMYLGINEGGSVAAFRNTLRGYVDMAVPYVDSEFLELVLSTEVTQRRDAAIHHHLIRTHCPPLMKIANSNNGAPLDASPLRRELTEKFLLLMRRMSLPGFRHYHNVQTWIRNALRDSVRSLLLEPRSLARGLYNPACLRELLDDGAPPARTRILPRLVMLEMWFRLFVDREIDGYQLQLDSADRPTQVNKPRQAEVVHGS